MDYKLKNLLYPKIDKSLSVKGTEKQIDIALNDFIGRNHEKLSYMGPSTNIFFTASDRDKMYNMCNTSDAEVLSIVKESKDIYVDKTTMSYPFNSFMPMLARFFLLKNQMDYVKKVSTYMALSIYPLLYTKYYKYPPNENVMAYTINNLSGKFKIRQTGNLLDTIAETAYGAFTLHEKALRDGSDKACLDIALSMRTRLNSFMKKLTDEYMRNHREGNYLNAELDNSTDKENFKEAQTTTTDIYNLSNKVSSTLIINGPNMNLIKVAANTNNVSVNELRNIILKISVDDNKDKIRDIVENIVTLYVIENKKTMEEIHSNDFLMYSLSMYAKHNTKNVQMIEIKQIIEDWMIALEIHKKTSNKSTLNGYRKAIYTFFVLCTQKYS